jgi:SAM-dependent methyltransferase
MTRIYREFEINVVLPEFPTECTILEIGGGSGWQAQKLASLGFKVVSIDIPYHGERTFPIIEYDGHSIPFKSASFDIVFSSNVLEHIPHVEQFQNEIQRVLKPMGKAVHIVPTAPWRLWTSLTHYPFYACASIHRVICPKRYNSPEAKMLSAPYMLNRRAKTLFQRVCGILFSPRHGERGTVFIELLLFSRFAWNRLFTRTGWIIEKRYTTKLFYSMYPLSQKPHLQLRKILSRFLGSACQVYILRPPNAHKDNFQ